VFEFAGAEVTAPLINEKPDMFHKNVITVQFAKVCSLHSFFRVREKDYV